MRTVAAMAIGACLLGLVLAMTSEPPKPLDLYAYKLTFEDNFKSLDVSAWGPGTRWIAHTPWNGDFGDAAFANPTPDFPFKLVDGKLQIEARKDADGKWRSGLLASTDSSGAGFSQQFGYFEMRAKLPPGPGLWPAFWLIGNKGPGASAEIDVMEYIGLDPTKYEATIHVWPAGNSKRNYQAKITVPVPRNSLVEQFHDYGVAVDADQIVFYLDRQEVGRTPTPPEHKQKLFLLIDLGMGSGFPIDKTPNPSDMLVEYVRAYTKS